MTEQIECVGGRADGGKECYIGNIAWCYYITRHHAMPKDDLPEYRFLPVKPVEIEIVPGHVGCHIYHYKSGKYIYKGVEK